MSGVAADGACSLALMKNDDPLASRMSMKLPVAQPHHCLMLVQPTQYGQAVGIYLHRARWRKGS